jgi:hypothetical protein
MRCRALRVSVGQVPKTALAGVSEDVQWVEASGRCQSVQVQAITSYERAPSLSCTISVELPMTRFAALAVFGSIPAFLAGQGHTSPPADTSITIAGKKIHISYFAPSMYGRKIMGGLVPYNTVWCTGANYATQIDTEADLDMGGLKMPKGSYSIWTLPNEKEWLLIINKEIGQFHLDYKQRKDFGRVKMNLKTLPTPVETFTIRLNQDGENKGTLALVWEKTEASEPFTVLR